VLGKRLLTSLCPSVSPPVCVEQGDAHREDSHEPSCAGILKFVDAFRICFKSDKNNGHLTGLPIYVRENISLSSVFAIERGGVLCAVQGEAKERVNDLNITIQHDRL
jgi:hypothetical protein